MSGKKYTSEHTVLYYESEKTQKMTLPMLLNVVIQVSGEQTAQYKEVNETMEKEGYAWIVLQHSFEIERMPVTNETIHIETRAIQYNKFFCYREFILTGEEGEELVKFLMVFAIIDLEKRKMIHIPDSLVEPYGAPFVKRPMRITRPDKVDEEDMTTSTYSVRYFDIDGNDHVNNSRYIEWMLDSLGAEFLTNHQIKSGNIKFEKELLYGQTIDSKASVKDATYGKKTMHQIVSSDETHCSASFTWA